MEKQKKTVENQQKQRKNKKNNGTHKKTMDKQ